ncbi:hypothetical protein PQX77_012620 [Marasmius sp. AFHP31]|nr:hypothetical protein PQX77_018686 [Marasmius sp. AFHP31]KAK1224446.1 hypothetical protein PQX77_012620 [Marasmius sp. AFHP31]
MSQFHLGTDQLVQRLLPSSNDSEPPLPVLMEIPKTDPYKVCLFISIISVAPWVEAFLCLGLIFNGMAFLAIAYFSFSMVQVQGYQINHLLRVIQRDGVVYFFVLFSSNLLWLLLLIYARSSLKFIHNTPQMIISAIMINRITLNLKEAASFREEDHTQGWSIETFEPAAARVRHGGRRATEYGQEGMTSDIEMNQLSGGSVCAPPIQFPQLILE